MAMVWRSNLLFHTRHLKSLSLIPKVNQTTANLCRVTGKARPQILFHRIPLLVCKRPISRFIRRPSVKKYKEIDNVPDHFQLIYRNTMDRFVFLTHVVVIGTAVLVGLVTAWKPDIYKTELDFSEWKDIPRTTENEVLVYMTVIAVIAVVIHIFVSQIPLRIYKIPKQPNYVFVFNGGIPLTRRNVKTKVGNVQYIGEPGVVPWKEHMYILNGERKVILFENYFQRPADLYILLGEQRDPELDQ